MMNDIMSSCSITLHVNHYRKPKRNSSSLSKTKRRKIKKKWEKNVIFSSYLRISSILNNSVFTKTLITSPPLFSFLQSHHSPISTQTRTLNKCQPIPKGGLRQPFSWRLVFTLGPFGKHSSSSSRWSVTELERELPPGP